MTEISFANERERFENGSMCVPGAGSSTAAVAYAAPRAVNGWAQCNRNTTPTVPAAWLATERKSLNFQPNR
jgi:hypothetical protein